MPNLNEHDFTVIHDAIDAWLDGLEFLANNRLTPSMAKHTSDITDWFFNHGALVCVYLNATP